MEAPTPTPDCNEDNLNQELIGLGINPPSRRILMKQIEILENRK